MFALNKCLNTNYISGVLCHYPDHPLCYLHGCCLLCCFHLFHRHLSQSSYSWCSHCVLRSYAGCSPGFFLSRICSTWPSPSFSCPSFRVLQNDRAYPLLHSSLCVCFRRPSSSCGSHSRSQLTASAYDLLSLPYVARTYECATATSCKCPHACHFQ